MTLRGLQGLDWVVMGGYGVAMLAIGWYYSRRQTSTKEYFLADRQARPFMIGISLFATLISTISYLAWPGEMIKHGPVILCGILTLPVIYLIVGYWLIPVFMNLSITSAYEILETRLGLGARLLGSGIFILTRLVWMGLLMYLAGKTIVVMLGWSPTIVPYVVVISGLITVVYTSMGGLRAVIVTDVLQAFILMVGAFLTILCISVKMGGVAAWWPTSWASNWDAQPILSFNPEVRVTVIGTLVANFAWWICTACSDQMAIQRYLATRDAKSARRAFLINNGADILTSFLLAMVGFALLGFFRVHPQFLTQNQNLVQDADYLFPHYIANFMPMGFAGLVVAGMFAAAMSSLSSGINSVTTVITVDFIDRFKKQRENEPHHVHRVKILALAIGVGVVLLSSVIGKVPGNIIEITTKTNGLFVGPMGGLFILALFIPFANSFGTIVGAIYGFAAAVLIAYWDVLTGRPGLSFQWIIVASLAVHLIVGLILSLLPIRQRGLLTPGRCCFVAILPLVLLFVWSVFYVHP
jgi:SSS family solute:Na+ symporter